MNVLKRLQETMREVEESSNHNGYWYKISDVLSIMVCGMLCNLQTIDDIYEWAKSEPTGMFLKHELRT